MLVAMTETTATKAGASDRRALILLAATIARCAVFLEITIVGVALPTMARDLDTTSSAAAWTVTVYTLALAAAVVPLGRLGDRVSHRRLLVVALAFLAGTSVLCAIAPTLPILLVARVLQGVAAAALMPSTQALVANAYPPKDRTQALGTMMGAQALVFAAGPVIGGLLINGPGWRWVFVIIAPLSLVGLALIVVFVPKQAVEHRGGGLDVLPSLLLAGSASAIVIAGVELGTSGAMVALLYLVAAIVLGWGFVVIDRRAAEPLLDPELFGRPRYLAGLLAGFLYQYGLLAMSVVMLTYFQVALDMPPQTAGLAFLPVSIPLLAAARVAPLVNRFGAARVMLSGLVLMGAAIVLTGLAALDRSYVLMVPSLVIAGLGIALTATPVQTVTVVELPESIRGLAGGGLSLVRQIGGAVGVALLTTVASVVERMRVGDLIDGMSSVEASDLESLVAGRPTAQQSLAQLPDQARTLVSSDAAHTLSVATCISLLVGGIVFLLGAFVTARLMAGTQPEPLEEDATAVAAE